MQNWNQSKLPWYKCFFTHIHWSSLNIFCTWIFVGKIFSQTHWIMKSLLSRSIKTLHILWRKEVKKIRFFYLKAIVKLIFCLCSIPKDTSPELRDLLLKMLKRNAKDRIEFGKFKKKSLWLSFKLFSIICSTLKLVDSEHVCVFQRISSSILSWNPLGNQLLHLVSIWSHHNISLYINVHYLVMGSEWRVFTDTLYSSLTGTSSGPYLTGLLLREPHPSQMCICITLIGESRILHSPL